MGNIGFTQNNNSDIYVTTILFDKKDFIDKVTKKEYTHIKEGNFSNVFNVMNKYAVKVIKNNSLFYLDNIVELTILNGMKSEYIVNSYGFYINDRKLCMVMEKMEATLCQVTNISYENKIKIANQLCNALDFLHSKKILHLDIKPSNILVNISSKFKVVLSDFSLSCRSDNLSILMKDHVISPYYRPYENLKGSKDYSDKSDIWSLGIVIYELFTETRIKNRIIKINVDLTENTEISVQFYIERLAMWNNWPPKIDYDLSKMLSLDICERYIISKKECVIAEEFNYMKYKHIIDRMFFKIKNEILIEEKWKSIFTKDEDIYKICYIIVMSMHESYEKILNFVDLKTIRYIPEILHLLNYNIN